MKVLVIGSGGREHAMAWALARSPRITEVFVAPGNGGTAREPGVRNLALSDFDELIAFVSAESVALTVVGPEAPLAAGIVDAFRAAGLAIFGPTRAAAQLESSKDFAKAFMQRHGIPTAAYATFTDAAAAHAHVDAQGAPIVVKADGLAAGKGVVVAETTAQAHEAIDAMLTGNRLGAAGCRVVIEAFLTGEEASFIAMVDGRNILALATSQDHKRLGDADQGPNTGGMGAYSPAPVVDPAMHEQIMRRIIEPTVRGMAAEGLPFTGFLYAGVMISPAGEVSTLEFNCRMGDPETQPILMRLRTDLVELLEAAIEGRLDRIKPDWDPRPALGVVLAARHYPGEPQTGDPVRGLPSDGNVLGPDCMVFHAGTRRENGQTVTSGGRVLCVTALGETVGEAQRSAYDGVASLGFDGMQFRRDIGYRAMCARDPVADPPHSDP